VKYKMQFLIFFTVLNVSSFNLTTILANFEFLSSLETFAALLYNTAI